MRTQYRLAEKTALFIGPLTRHMSQTALRLAEEGCDVALATPDVKMGENLANAISDLKEIDTSAGRALCVPLNTPTSQDPAAVIKAVTAQFGALDILFEMTEGDPTAAVTEALVYIKNRRHGRILIVRPLLSDLKIENFKGVNGLETLPSVEKLKNSVQNWAREFNPPQLTVNGIIVGPTEELLTRLFPKAGPSSAGLKELQKTFPHVRMADASDLAETLTFLASTISSAIHGQMIPVVQGNFAATTAAAEL